MRSSSFQATSGRVALITDVGPTAADIQDTVADQRGLLSLDRINPTYAPTYAEFSSGQR